MVPGLIDQLCVCYFIISHVLPYMRLFFSFFFRSLGWSFGSFVPSQITSHSPYLYLIQFFFLFLFFFVRLFVPSLPVPSHCPHPLQSHLLARLIGRNSASAFVVGEAVEESAILERVVPGHVVEVSQIYGKHDASTRKSANTHPHYKKTKNRRGSPVYTRRQHEQNKQDTRKKHASPPASTTAWQERNRVVVGAGT